VKGSSSCSGSDNIGVSNDASADGDQLLGDEDPESLETGSDVMIHLKVLEQSYKREPPVKIHAAKSES